MTTKNLPSPSMSRLRLKPLEEETFPRNWTVHTDKPGGLVVYENGLVGFEATNVVIRVRAAQNQFPLHPGPLSLLFTLGGQEVHEVDGRRFVVDERSYLIHNMGQMVCSGVDSPTPVESFTIGFWPGFAEGVLRDLVTPTDHLIDNPLPVRNGSVKFFDQLYPHDDVLSPLLFRLRAALQTDIATRGWQEEMHHQLVLRMLMVHRRIGREIEQLPAVRAATRTELYRRLHRARDFMEANLEQTLTIPQIAEAAWFSPFHFLRQFKQAFGETPHQYITRRRLERAQTLLLSTEMSVTDICYAVGFESLGSFSGLFRQRLGLSPQQFRSHERTRPHA